MFSAGGERYCHICGQRIAGQYAQYTTGLIVCSHCERTAPRCARCKIPVQPRAAARSPRGMLLCAPCARTVDHCNCCGEPILEQWFRFEELLPSPEPRRFCAACVRDKPRCDLCRAPIGPRSKTLSDGQYRCALCASDLAIGEAAIRLIYTDALEAMTAALGAPLRRVPPLEVVSRRRMGELRRTYAHGFGDTAGVMPAAPGLDMPDPQPAASGSRHVLGFYVRAHGRPMIYVEAGLTRGLLLGTLAHEVGHAWQAEQLGPAAGAIDPLLSEGFAEWVAYTALLARGFRTLAARARDRQDDYGHGLRHFLEIERTRGRPALLQVARVSKV